jgi:hypothetical protein
MLGFVNDKSHLRNLDKVSPSFAQTTVPETATEPAKALLRSFAKVDPG